MSDERLRTLERTWKETGALRDEAAYLSERVRAGELSSSMLELVAYLGHEAAAIAASSDSAPTGRREEFCEKWAELGVSREDAEFLYLVNSLGHWGDECCARAAFAVARHVLDLHWDPQVSTAPLETLRALGAWILCPCDEHVTTSADAIQVSNDSVPAGTNHDARLSVWVAGDAAAVPARIEPRGLFGPKAMAAFRTAQRALLLSNQGSLRAAVSAELVPWALGTADPVREWTVLFADRGPCSAVRLRTLRQASSEEER